MNPCDENARCILVKSNFNFGCQCLSNYEGSGFKCEKSMYIPSYLLKIAGYFGNSIDDFFSNISWFPLTKTLYLWIWYFQIDAPLITPPQIVSPFWPSMSHLNIWCTDWKIANVYSKHLLVIPYNGIDWELVFLIFWFVFWWTNSSYFYRFLIW